MFNIGISEIMEKDKKFLTTLSKPETGNKRKLAFPKLDNNFTKPIKKQTINKSNDNMISESSMPLSYKQKSRSPSAHQQQFANSKKTSIKSYDMNNKLKENADVFESFGKTPMNIEKADSLLTNFNAEKSSSAPLRTNSKLFNKQLIETKLRSHNDIVSKNDLKNLFTVNDYNKPNNEYRPLINMKKSLLRTKSNEEQPLKSLNLEKSEVFIGNTYNDPNTLYKTTEKNKKLYYKINELRKEISKKTQQMENYSSEITMLKHEIKRAEIKISRLNDDNIFHSGEIERLNGMRMFTEKQIDEKLQNIEDDLKAELKKYEENQKEELNSKIKELESEYDDWKLKMNLANKELEELVRIKKETEKELEALELDIKEKKADEDLQMNKLRHDRLQQIEVEKLQYMESNPHFVENKYLEAKRTEKLNDSERFQKENIELDNELQSIKQKIVDEQFLLSTLMDDAQMKSSELMKYGMEKMEPLNERLEQLKEEYKFYELEEQKISKKHSQTTKFISTIEAKIKTMKK